MAREPRFLLVRPGLMRQLMERTGTGSDISGRELAARVGVANGTIDGLLNGATKTQPFSVAHHICDVIGVDLLVLWAPTGRAVPAEDAHSDTPRTAVPA
ncbi:helix-turn-helix domain-containing protein [Streptomyces antibioticus]|uniref:helix-turn-helix domain-containing protein n=1 Tax=Streptomyces antibioticus TaxID=1890 RepID=UPI0033A90A39